MCSVKDVIGVVAHGVHDALRLVLDSNNGALEWRPARLLAATIGCLVIKVHGRFIAELRHTLVVEVGLVHGRWRKSFTKVADKKLLSQKTMK